MPSHQYTPDPRGLVSKYIVYRRNEGGSQGEPIEGPTFTLRPFDPHARIAMLAYAASVQTENPTLSRDLVSLFDEHSAEPYASIGLETVQGAMATLLLDRQGGRPNVFVRVYLLSWQMVIHIRKPYVPTSQVFEAEDYDPRSDASDTWVHCSKCGGTGEIGDLHEVDPLWYGPGDGVCCDECDGAGGHYGCEK